MRRLVNGPALRVALTIDAEHPDRSWCPPGNIERILDALRTAGARATFFVQGRWVGSYPDAARRIVDEGHLVGNHSHYHARMPLLHNAGLREDILAAQEIIWRTMATDPRPWFRCPFGKGADDPRVLDILDELGYRNVHWHVEPADWDPTRGRAEIAEATIRGVEAHGDGAVVLLHSWPGATGESIAPIIEGLRALGATFVAVDELKKIP
jgi:peptidoglycan/xylan/chitin deacetylase (PgdA/CDA1 family)